MNMRAISLLLKHKMAIIPGIVFGVFAVAVQRAMAEEVVHELVENIEHAEHESGGLPQFDPSSFSSQVVWLAIVFVALYVIFSKKSLPKISTVLETRENKIQGDRDLAENMKNEAVATLEAYEKSLGDARAEAARISADTAQTVKTKAEQSLNAFKDKAESQMSALESSLNSSKHQAMDEMNTIAAEIASAAAEKIVGMSTDINQAKTVVQSLNKLSKAA